MVNDGKHRTRYIILTILPECSFPYDWNYALLHTMSIFSLSGWELSRATLEASKQWMKVMMEKEPKQMILNNARIQWVSLYVGKKEWTGSTKFSDHKGISLADDGDDADVDMHFLSARESDDPLMKRLVEAFDVDNPAPTATDTTESTTEAATPDSATD